MQFEHNAYSKMSIVSMLVCIQLSNLKREAVIERHYCYDGVQLRGTSRSAASSVAVLQVTIMTFNHGFKF